jgi:cytochrome c-type biogenesis protein CcmE
MSNKAAKISLTGLVLATAFGVLMYSSLGESLQYYKYVDEVMAEPAAWHGKNLQVHGIVVPDSIGRKDNTLEWRFQLQRNGKVLTAYYNGIVPDTFKADSEVVLTGTMDAKGFHATEMTAKCPSKYDAAPAGPAAGGAEAPPRQQSSSTPTPSGGA